jgi:hypothetical protein
LIMGVIIQMTIRHGCESGFVLEGDNCVPIDCEPGFILVGGNCKPIVCPAGSELDSNGRICEPLPDPDCDPSRPECAPTQCPDGRIVPPGVPCPDDALPCDDPNAPEWCSVPTECPDGTVIPPGEQCPDVDYGGEEIPEVPEEPGEDNDNGNGDNGDDSQPDPDPPEDNEGSGTDTATDTG